MELAKRFKEHLLAGSDSYSGWSGGLEWFW